MDEITKEDYIKMLKDSVESDILNGTEKLESVLAIISCDKNLRKKDREELTFDLAKYLLNGINEYKTNLLINGNDQDIENFNSVIDELNTSKKEYSRNNKFPLN